MVPPQPPGARPTLVGWMRGSRSAGSWRGSPGLAPTCCLRPVSPSSYLCGTAAAGRVRAEVAQVFRLRPWTNLDAADFSYQRKTLVAGNRRPPSRQDGGSQARYRRGEQISAATSGQRLAGLRDVPARQGPGGGEERVTGIEPAFSAWESERPDFSGRERNECAGQRADGRAWTRADRTGRAMNAPCGRWRSVELIALLYATT